MTKARFLADLLSSTGDVKIAALDNAPAPTKATVDALGIAATSVTGSQASAITANTAKVTYPSADSSKLSAVEVGATADQTKSDIEGLGIAVGSSQMPAGSVLQVVYGSTSTGVVSTTTNTWVGSGCSATITPQFANSKILVVGNLVAQVRLNGGVDAQMNTGIKRDSTVIFGNINWDELRLYTSTVSNRAYGARVPFNHLDSPSTTSAITYELQGALRQGTYLDMQMASRHASTITLMEIAQ